MRLSAATLGVPLGHRLLHRDRTAHRVDYTGKFHQQAVASGLDDAAFVLDDLRIEEFAAQRFETFERALFVLPHQPRIPRHIGGEDRGETASCSHPSGSPALRRPVSQIAINAGENIRDQKALYRAIVSPG